MANFSINLSKELTDSDDESGLAGSLFFDGVGEYFHAPTRYWDRDGYLSQWREAFQRLLDGNEISVIITVMYKPEEANFLTFWPMYRVGDTVYFQEMLLFLEELDEPFDENNIYKSIAPRDPAKSDKKIQGVHAVSEWAVSIKDIKAALISSSMR